MKKVYKILSLLIAFCLVFSVFTACNGDNPSTESSSNSGSADNQPENGGVGEISGTVIANGISEYVVVTSANPSEPEMVAANELKTYLFSATGVSLQIVADNMVNYTSNSKIFSIGETKIIQNLRKNKQGGFDAIDYSALNENGFIVKTHGNSIFMDGVDDRGTIYAVLDYLEKICGIKFLAEGFAYVPKIDTLSFYELNIIEKPAFVSRAYWGGGGAEGYLNRLDAEAIYGGGIEWCDVDGYNSIHNSMLHVPTSKYYTSELKAQNAHMYARQYENEVPENPIEVCWTDGIKEDGTLDESMEVSAIKVALESLKEFVLRDSNADFFMFGQEDHSGCCQCPDCQKMADKYTRGGISIRFCNVLATEIQKWADAELGGRKINVVTFAYMYSDTPPAKLNEKGEYVPIDDTVKAVDNLFIRLAPINSTPYYPITDTESGDRQYKRYEGWTKKWAAVADHFMVWRYDTNFNNAYVYFPTLNSLAQDLREYRDIGVYNITCQDMHIANNNWQAIMASYIAGKLMWNPDQNAYKLRDEFVYYYFGPARDIMNAYFYDLDEFFYSLHDMPGMSFGIYETKMYSAEVWSASNLQKQLATLDRAIAVVEASNESEELKAAYIDHIKLVKTSPLSILLLNYDIYYIADTAGKREVAKEFFALVDYFEIKNMQESETTYDELRAKLGV